MFACPLNPHFAHSATHCVEGVTGINIKPLVPMPKPADDERVEGGGGGGWGGGKNLYGDLFSKHISKDF